MTLVAVWRAENRLMSIADTRIIIRGTGNVLTEHGPKILPLKVRGRRPGASGFIDQDAFQFDIGFAYSGATLSALSAHALASALLGNLAGPTGSPPSMTEIAYFIGRVSAEYMREVGQLNGNGALFSAIVFGFCHVTHQLRGFEIKPRLNHSPFTCDIVEHPLQQNNSIVVIGSRPDLLRERIEADREAAIERGDTHPILDMDRPTRVLQTLIDEEVDPSVGGIIQQGWATPAGFELVAKMRPITPRPPSPRNAGLFVLGFDIMDIQQIGANIISLIGR
jgi:hypothetical protein